MDIDAAFDEISNWEEQAIAEGEELGAERGRELGVQEGFELGCALRRLCALAAGWLLAADTLRAEQRGQGGRDWERARVLPRLPPCLDTHDGHRRTQGAHPVRVSRASDAAGGCGRGGLTLRLANCRERAGKSVASLGVLLDAFELRVNVAALAGKQLLRHV